MRRKVTRTVLLFGRKSKTLYFCPPPPKKKPLKDAQIGGRFIFIPMSIFFNKVYKSPTDIVVYLKTEG